ncbi:MAG: alpha/beta hydrolase [Actinobacteria bacterium]|nr:alpha/beta hydrolase [Actinomycetota bacterium]
MPGLRTADGADLHFELEGEGPLLLLVHGGTGTGAYDWEHLRPALARSYRLLVPDLRGHGRSSDPGWLLGPEAIGDDVLALIDHVGERPVATVAFSIGAAAMLRLAIRQPAFTGALVPIAPSLHARPDRVEAVTTGPWPQGLVDLVHEHGEHGDHWKRLRNRLAQTFWRDFPEITDDELGSIAVPLLAVWGDRDPIEPVETGLRLARTVQRGQLLVVPDAGHFLMRTRAEELLLVLERFLARHVPR